MIVERTQRQFLTVVQPAFLPKHANFLKGQGGYICSGYLSTRHIVLRDLLPYCDEFDVMLQNDILLVKNHGTIFFCFPFSRFLMLCLILAPYNLYFAAESVTTIIVLNEINIDNYDI